ncbi:MAG: EamA family transporter [Candidatus Riflebacteria bacterium]|nr:EamA family transporter [Candidatus Riflebacteria bacterium]
METDNQNSIKKGTIICLIAGLMWGFSGVCGQYIMQQKGITTTWLVPFRLVFAGLIMITIGFIKQGRQFIAVWKKDYVRLLVFALCGMTFCQFSYFSSIAASNAGTATVLQQFSIIFVMLYTCFRKRKLPDKIELISLVLALIGAFLMATHGNVDSLVMSKAGLFWGFCNALAVTLYTLLPVKLIKEYGALAVTGWAMMIGGIVLQLVFKPWTIDVTLDAQVITAVIIIIIFGTILPFAMYLRGVVLAGANRAVMLSNMEPMTATILSALLLGQQFHLMDIIGSICILSTIFILSYKPNDNK